MSDDSERLVLIGVAHDEIEANIWRDILARDGIGSYVKNPEPLSSFGVAALPGTLQVFVQTRDEKRARWLLGERISPA